MQIVNLPQLAWHGAGSFQISLPEDWQVEMCHMAGYDRHEMEAGEIYEAINNPIGTKRLYELARGKKEAVIVFDDMTRVTRLSKIVPIVLTELSSAGIRADNVRFICGLGLHGALSRSDFVKKLGEDVVSDFLVYNHNPFGNCVYVGTTSTLKTEVHINEEYMKCDLKILIGSCVPHPTVGFGGGSKLVMPGIASYECIQWNHKLGGASKPQETPMDKPPQGMGLIENNILKKDMDEAAELAGIDFLINTLVNEMGENVSLYAGSWKSVFAAAVKEAKTHYVTRFVKDKDIVISNNFAKASESMIGLAPAFPLLHADRGDIVMIANAPEGQITHYLIGPFGKTSFGIQYKDFKLPGNVNQVIIFNEYPHPGSSWIKENKKVVYKNQWFEVLDILRRFHGTGTRVAIIPDGTNQYFQ